MITCTCDICQKEVDPDKLHDIGDDFAVSGINHICTECGDEAEAMRKQIERVARGYIRKHLRKYLRARKKNTWTRAFRWVSDLAYVMGNVDSHFMKGFKGE